MNKYFFTLLGMTFFLMLSACNAGNGSTSVQSGSGTTADFFKLAIVPNQTVNTSTFEVQAVAELLNPSGTLAAPVVVDNSGVSHIMTLKTLQWPSTAVDSITVWSATVPLVSDQVNTLTVISGTKSIVFNIKHKTTLSVTTVTNDAGLQAALAAAITDATKDVILIDYNITNLGPIINNVGNGVVNVRNYWVTVKPASGRAVVSSRDAGAADTRPFIDWVNFDSVVWGSDLSDQGGGQYYASPAEHVWLSNCQFRGKYKSTWLSATPMSAVTVADIRTSLTELQKVYITNALYDGTATDYATSFVELARDLTFKSHRGDFNDFGKVVLNLYGEDIDTVRNSANTDYLHNDGFQLWAQTNGVVFKGLKIASPNIPANIQPFLLDTTFTPDYQNVLLDTLIIAGAAPGTILQAQVAGHLTNSRISNISFPNQHITLRYDFTIPNGAFLPTNVFMNNFDTKDVQYIAAAGHTSVTYNSANVANPSDISPELTANVDLAGTTFTNIKVAP